MSELTGHAYIEHLHTKLSESYDLPDLATFKNDLLDENVKDQVFKLEAERVRAQTDTILSREEFDYNTYIDPTGDGDLGNNNYSNGKTHNPVNDTTSYNTSDIVKSDGDATSKLDAQIAIDVNEDDFLKWYKEWSDITGLNPDPDASEHFYDYRAAFANDEFPEEVNGDLESTDYGILQINDKVWEDNAKNYYLKNYNKKWEGKPIGELFRDKEFSINFAKDVILDSPLRFDNWVTHKNYFKSLEQGKEPSGGGQKFGLAYNSMNEWLANSKDPAIFLKPNWGMDDENSNPIMTQMYNQIGEDINLYSSFFVDNKGNPPKDPKSYQEANDNYMRMMAITFSESSFSADSTNENFEKEWHWPSSYKHDDHPNRFVAFADTLVDTKTNSKYSLDTVWSNYNAKIGNVPTEVKNKWLEIVKSGEDNAYAVAHMYLFDYVYNRALSTLDEKPDTMIVYDADGTKKEVPATTHPFLSTINAIPGGIADAGKLLYNMGRGMADYPIYGVTQAIPGLFDYISTGKIPEYATQEKFDEYLMSNQLNIDSEAVETLGWLLGIPMQYVDKGAKYLGETVSDATGVAALGAAVESGINFAPWILPFMKAKYNTKVRTQTGHTPTIFNQLTKDAIPLLDDAGNKLSKVFPDARINVKTFIENATKDMNPTQKNQFLKDTAKNLNISVKELLEGVASGADVTVNWATMTKITDKPWYKTLKEKLGINSDAEFGIRIGNKDIKKILDDGIKLDGETIIHSFDEAKDINKSKTKPNLNKDGTFNVEARNLSGTSQAAVLPEKIYHGSNKTLTTKSLTGNERVLIGGDNPMTLVKKLADEGVDGAANVKTWSDANKFLSEYYKNDYDLIQFNNKSRKQLGNEYIETVSGKSWAENQAHAEIYAKSTGRDKKHTAKTKTESLIDESERSMDKLKKVADRIKKSVKTKPVKTKPVKTKPVKTKEPVVKKGEVRLESDVTKKLYERIDKISKATDKFLKDNPNLTKREKNMHLNRRDAKIDYLKEKINIEMERLSKENAAKNSGRSKVKDFLDDNKEKINNKKTPKNEKKKLIDERKDANKLDKNLKKFSNEDGPVIQSAIIPGLSQGIEKAVKFVKSYIDGKKKSPLTHKDIRILNSQLDKAIKGGETSKTVPDYLLINTKPKTFRERMTKPIMDVFDFEVQTDKAARNLEGRKTAAPLTAATERSTFEILEFAKKNNITEERMFHMLNDMETTKNLFKVEKDGTIRIDKKKADKLGFSSNEQGIMEWYRNSLNEMFQKGVDEGIFKESVYIENYVRHMVEGLDDLPPDIKNKLGEIGQNSLSSKPSFAMKRIYETLAELEKDGYTVNYNMIHHIQDYATVLERAIANKNFTTYLRGGFDSNGNPLISSKPRKITGRKDYKGGELQYRELDMPGFARFAGFTDDAGNIIYRKGNDKIYVHPDIYKTLESVVQKNAKHFFEGGGAFFRNYFTFKNNVKRIVMHNPMIHGWNIFSDVLDESSGWLVPRFGKAGKIVFKGFKDKDGALSSGFKSEFGFLDFNDYSSYKRFKALSGSSEGYNSMVSNGYKKNFDKYFPELVPDTNIPKGISKQGREYISAYVNKLKEGMDEFMWERIVGNSSDWLFAEQVKRQAIDAGFLNKKGKQLKSIPEKTLLKYGRVAAEYTNNQLGTLSRLSFTSNQGWIMSLGLFARNWSIGILRTMTALPSGVGLIAKDATSALGLNKGKGYTMGTTGKFARGGYVDIGGRRVQPLPRFLQWRGMTKLEYDFVARESVKHVAKGGIQLVAFNEIISQVLQTKNLWEQDLDTHLINNPNRRYWNVINNPRGYKMDIYSGRKLKSGKELYYINPLYRYLRDAVRWYTDPLHTAGSKIDATGRLFGEIFMNRDYWGNKIVQDWDSYPKKAMKFADHSFTALNPYMTNTKEKVPYNVIPHNWAITAFGTWSRQAHSDNLLMTDGYEQWNRTKTEKHDVSKAINDVLLNGSSDEFYKFIQKPEILEYFPNPIETIKYFEKKNLHPFRFFFDHMIKEDERFEFAETFVREHMYSKEWLKMGRGKIYKEWAKKNNIHRRLNKEERRWALYDKSHEVFNSKLKEYGSTWSFIKPSDDKNRGLKK